MALKSTSHRRAGIGDVADSFWNSGLRSGSRVEKMRPESRSADFLGFRAWGRVGV